MSLLENLGKKYVSSVTSTSTRIDSTSIKGLYGHLLSHELHVAHYQPFVDRSLANANFAFRTSVSCGKRCGQSSNSEGHGSLCNNNDNHSSLAQGLDHGPFSSSLSISLEVVCQVCNRTSHSIFDAIIILISPSRMSLP